MLSDETENRPLRVHLVLVRWLTSTFRAYPPSYHTPAEGGRQSQGHHSQSPDDDMQPLSRGKERERETSTERYPYPQTDSRHVLVDYKDVGDVLDLAVFSYCLTLLSFPVAAFSMQRLTFSEYFYGK